MFHYSLLDGLSKPEHIASRCEEIGSPACAISDHGSISGHIQFLSKMKKANLKPILGIEFYVCSEDSTVRKESNRKLSHLCILAKNDDGWKDLVQMVSLANTPEMFYHKPRLDLNRIAEYASKGNLIGFSGHIGSTMANTLFDKENGGLSSVWRQEATRLAKWLQNAFGKDNFFLEIQLMDHKQLPKQVLIADCIRTISNDTGIPCIAVPDAHYTRQEDAEDQRVLLCSNMRVTIQQASKPEFGLSGFFRSRQYHIPSFEEMQQWHTEEELDNTLLLASRVEEYQKILRPPVLPEFECPNEMNPDEYLRHLCSEGWNQKVQGVVSQDKHGEYKQRLERELSVLQGAGLSSYFLIVSDIIDFVRKNEWLPGPGRGCLAPDSPIYLENHTLKPISNIKVGDRVYCKDGESRKVINTFKYNTNNDEKLVNIKCYYGDSVGTTLTRDHKILAESTQVISDNPKEKKYERPKQKLSWIEAGKLKVGDWVFVPVPKCSNPILSRIDLSHVDNETDLVSGTSECYHQQLNPLTNNFKLLYTYKRWIDVDEDFFYMLGRFTGDGWLTKNKFDIGFAFNSDDTKGINRIKRYFGLYSIHVNETKHKTKNLTQLIVKCKHLYQFMLKWFNDYKRTSKTKHIPQFVKETNDNKYIKSFIQGLEDSDGSTDKHKKKITTSSYQLASEIRMLYWKLGIPASLTRNNRKPDKRGYNNQLIIYDVTTPLDDRQKQYHFIRTKNGIMLRIRKIETISNIQHVYDFEVEGKHNYLTSSFIVHNSAAGCLVSYLIGVTSIDPIPFGLIFERFYNAGRNTEDRISMPDIDMDIPKHARPYVIEYMRKKYGEDKVGQMVTFQTMKGRGAIKDVLRAYGGISFDEMNEITRNIIEESKIADELQKMKEERGNSSIIQWCLENTPKKLKKWCFIQEDGSLGGPLARRFEQAMRLEGTKTNTSKHAAGIVIAPEPLSAMCPMIYDKESDHPITGFEMNDMENVGGIKFDALGIVLLDKIMGVQTDLAYGKIKEIGI